MGMEIYCHPPSGTSEYSGIEYSQGSRIILDWVAAAFDWRKDWDAAQWEYSIGVVDLPSEAVTAADELISWDLQTELAAGRLKENPGIKEGEFLHLRQILKIWRIWDTGVSGSY